MSEKTGATGEQTGQAEGQEVVAEGTEAPPAPETFTVYNPYLKRDEQVTRKQMEEALSKSEDYTQKTQNFQELVKGRGEEYAVEYLKSVVAENPGMTAAQIAAELGVEVEAAATGEAAGEDAPAGKGADSEVAVLAQEMKALKAELQRMEGRATKAKINHAHKVFAEESVAGTIANAALVGIVSDPQLLQRRFGGDVMKAAAEIAREVGAKTDDEKAAELVRLAASKGTAAPSPGKTQAGQEKPKGTLHERIQASLDRREEQQ